MRLVPPKTQQELIKDAMTTYLPARISKEMLQTIEEKYEQCEDATDLLAALFDAVLHPKIVSEVSGDGVPVISFLAGFQIGRLTEVLRLDTEGHTGNA